MTIDSILTEWSYRLPKGYPTRPKDYELLYHVILEMTDLTPLEARHVVNKAQGLNEQTEISILSEIGLSDDIVNQIQNIYDDLSNEEKQEFDKNFRKHSIDSFFSGGYKPFMKFYSILPSGKAAGGMGRGEIQVLLAVNDSMPGGTAQHDIVLSNGQWEVKEIGKVAEMTKAGVLGKEPEAKTFRPAKAGMPQQGDLLTKIQNFYDDIVIPYSELADPFEFLKHVVEPGSWNRLEQFISILDKIFVPLISKVKEGREISYASGWNIMYQSFKIMHKLFWETKFDSDIQDTRLTIKTANSETSYWITKDDYEKIKNGSAEKFPVSVHIGELIENENSNAVLWFSKIKRNNFIADPESMILEFDTIKSKFFTDILGLIAYDINRPGLPMQTTINDWAIVSLSQSQWVFGLKSAFSKYEFIQQQS